MAPVIDLRSDTVTRPTPAMRAAMAEAPVGDDVYAEDPSVRALEERVADLLGKEAALFVPSGTMSNQVAVRLHCRPGEELICEAGCHIHNYEQGGCAQLSGVAVRPVEGRYGVVSLEQLEDLVRPESDMMVRTRTVAIENTHNRGAGKIQPYDVIESICDWAHHRGLTTHLDGARIWNAAVATGIEPRTWAAHFDTVSVCFSKGLGAPVGSALAMPRALAKEARRHRRLFGGGMRQSGVLAAAALYALKHHVERLTQDHENARLLAAAIRSIPGLHLAPDEIDTNMVIFRIDPSIGSASELCGRLKEQGVLMLPVGTRLVRAVTHLDVSRADVERAADALAGSARVLTGSSR